MSTGTFLLALWAGRAVAVPTAGAARSSVFQYRCVTDRPGGPHLVCPGKDDKEYCDGGGDCRRRRRGKNCGCDAAQTFCETGHNPCSEDRERRCFGGDPVCPGKDDHDGCDGRSDCKGENCDCEVGREFCFTRKNPCSGQNEESEHPSTSPSIVHELPDQNDENKHPSASPSYIHVRPTLSPTDTRSEHPSIGSSANPQTSSTGHPSSTVASISNRPSSAPTSTSQKGKHADIPPKNWQPSAGPTSARPHVTPRGNRAPSNCKEGESCDEKGGLSIGALAGIIGGSVFVLALLVCVGCRRRSKRRRKVDNMGEPLLRGISDGDIPDEEAPKLPPPARPSNRAKKSFRLMNTNLYNIGSKEDTDSRKKIAQSDKVWMSGVGSAPGVEVWRIEDRRGIAAWPREMYGHFHRGDTYIVLHTAEDPDYDRLNWDVHFWIGSESSLVEHGVAAAKAVELDDLLGGEAMQHRQVEGHESAEFLRCFPRGLCYMAGGIDVDFRHLSAEGMDDDSLHGERHLYRVTIEEGHTRSHEVPLAFASLDDGEAFLLDAGTRIYTWYGSGVPSFARSACSALANSMREDRPGDCKCVLDVGDDDEEFWDILGGWEEVKAAARDDDGAAAGEGAAEGDAERQMYIISDAEGFIDVHEVPMSLDNLASDDVFIVDCGDDLYIWVGEGSSLEQKEQSMVIAYSFLRELDRSETTRVHRIKEGQERKSPSFLAEFK